MEPEAVVEELLAVVGEEHDEGVVVEARLLQLAHEAAELAVAERDVAVVLRDHPLAVERLLVVGARVLRGVALRRVRLEHPVERLGWRVRHVGVHRVDVEERRQPPVRLQEHERRVDDHVGADELAALVVLAVEAGEHVEARVERRLLAVDDGVRDGGARRPAALGEPLPDRRVRGVERVPELHGAVARGKLRGEDGRDRRLRPRRVRHRGVEDHRVLRERVELRRRLPRVAVDAGVVGAQRVDEVDDHERRLLPRARHRRRAPERARGVARLLVAAGLEHQLAPVAGEAREIHLGAHEAAVLRVRDRVDELRPHDRLTAVLLRLDRELDARPVVVARVDRAGQEEPPVLRHVEREAQAAGRPGREPAHEHVVDAQAAPAGLEHRLAVLPGGRCLEQPLGGHVPKVDRGSRSAAAGRQEGEGGGGRHQSEGRHRVEQAKLARAPLARQTRGSHVLWSPACPFAAAFWR